MDIGIIKGILTLILMGLFVMLVMRVYSPSNKKSFERTGASILEHDLNKHGKTDH